MKAAKNSYVIIEDKNEILMFLDYNSTSLFNKVKETVEDSRYILVRKYLTHSDLSTAGKPTKSDKLNITGANYVKSFLLYYDSAQSLTRNIKLPTAAQSCIGLPKEFYDITSIAMPQKGSKNIIGWSAFLPKDTLRYYSMDDFEKIRIYNNKTDFSQQIKRELINFNINTFGCLNNEEYYQFDRLTIAAHGLGTTKDKLLTYLRRITFKGDVINFLIDKEEQKLYIFFERNERFFSLLSEINNLPISPPIWNEYNEVDKKSITLVLYALNKAEIEINNETEATNVEVDNVMDSADITNVLNDYFAEYNKKVNEIIQSGQKPKYRWYQTKWREVLIKLDEIEFHSKGYAVCAISGLKGKYEKLGRFFIASHIKPYAQCIAECDYSAAFDPHNGLILSANADALFDQHLISIDVDHNGLIVKKSAVETISKLKNIIAKERIDNQYLTEERKSYLRIHKSKFDTV